MTKIKKLSFVFVALLVVSLVLTWVGRKEKVVAVDKTLFAVADTTQMVSLAIASGADQIVIKREKKSWKINDQYNADPQLIYLTQRILNAVQTQRPVSQSNFESIKKELQTDGKLVTVGFEDGHTQQFYAGGNTAKTTAYFGNESLTKIYTVAIPGYKSYLSGIFELSLNQWRDRVLFASSWRTIQELEINYTSSDQENLSIRFDQQFLAVRGVSVLDTAALMNYLQPLEFFQLNDYLTPGNFPKYDSLLDEAPIATVKLQDINPSNNRQLAIYPKIAGEQFYLVMDQANEMIVVDAVRMERFLVGSSAFKRQE
ncbi:DUF4340 domain-containing protein [Reichenbachiella carrageenanivorans]|uniref:DUF4340 domain-containing protein n=1 Tax=Reichenbachiella carrageenanivorans TaxID=2979869 RepID=A0ABY6CX63_9BACT|nr:DUF4340 domain-containing protein [Reichenbachiella carrageenanivorans]UXX78309.1 DUF4340 domain-containing protein [Reichenbachiella carrageenanivorans]